MKVSQIQIEKEEGDSEELLMEEIRTRPKERREEVEQERQAREACLVEMKRFRDEGIKRDARGGSMM